MAVAGSRMENSGGRSNFDVADDNGSTRTIAASFFYPFQSLIYYLCFKLNVLHLNVFSTPHYSLSTSHQASEIGYGEVALRRLVPRAR